MYSSNGLINIFWNILISIFQVYISRYFKILQNIRIFKFKGSLRYFNIWNTLKNIKTSWSTLNYFEVYLLKYLQVSCIDMVILNCWTNISKNYKQIVLYFDHRIFSRYFLILRNQACDIHNKDTCRLIGRRKWMHFCK